MALEVVCERLAHRLGRPRAGDRERLGAARRAAQDERARTLERNIHDSARARSAGMPADVPRSVAPAIQLSKTSAVARRSGSLVLATSSATVAIGHASA